MDFFENYAIVAMQSDNVTFCACKILKETSGFNLKKTIFFHQVVPTSKKQLKYFSNANNSTTLTAPGVSREAKLSTKFEIGNLVRYTIASMPSQLCSSKILVGFDLGQFSGRKGCVTQILSLAGNATK